MSRRVRYQVAMSLDGFIAGTKGEYDWIVGDPAIDFAALFAEFDTAVLGRKTYELIAAQGDGGVSPGIETWVFSRTLPAVDKPGLHVINDDPKATVAALKKKKGKDIWLFGGGELCRSLLDAGLVDTVEVAVMPVMICAGVPLVAPGDRVKLVLADHKVLKSGIVMLAYSVRGTRAAPPRIRYLKPRTRTPTKRGSRK